MLDRVIDLQLRKKLGLPLTSQEEAVVTMYGNDNYVPDVDNVYKYLLRALDGQVQDTVFIRSSVALDILDILNTLRNKGGM